MRLLASSHLSVFFLLAILQPSLAAKSAATSFCKCICFNNSTIIPLNPPPSSSRREIRSLDMRSPGGDYAEAETEAIPGWSFKRDADDGLDAAVAAAAAEASSLPLTLASSPSSSSEEEAEETATAVVAPSTATTTAISDGDAANDRPPTGRPPNKERKFTCSDCTRAFCLDYNLPICKGAEEEDVFTTCFQRDSLKDETVVVVFIFATAGLLGWAVVKPWIDRLREGKTFSPLPQRDIHRVNIGG
ncbi:hypothetical protein PV08_00082 [Exophiala spinifera]|uniref:AN1-type domain-containing protein n=1 Tax=Exophiala spinifera TaxID=91928 RepID=A0A0D2BLU0_9EURO|nr:uncharacterized protein PV08_00082 [Exophiala spinifera]KIW19510.1 hypothetical protein PV08_00082 [Exophiala spinifera]